MQINSDPIITGQLLTPSTIDHSYRHEEPGDNTPTRRKEVQVRRYSHPGSPNFKEILEIVPRDLKNKVEGDKSSQQITIGVETDGLMRYMPRDPLSEQFGLPPIKFPDLCPTESAAISGHNARSNDSFLLQLQEEDDFLVASNSLVHDAYWSLPI